MDLHGFREKGKLKLASGLLALTIAVAGGVTVAAADGAQGTLAAAPRTAKAKALKDVRRDELDAAATTLHISVKQLKSDLRGGKTLAQEAQSASPPVNASDLTAAMRTALKADLDKAMANKQITTDREHAILARFDKDAGKLLDRTWGARKKK